MVRMIVERARNLNFTLITGNKQRKFRCLKNGVPQGSLLAHIFLSSIAYIRFGFHIFQKLCLCGLSKLVALFLELEGLGGDFKSKHDHIFTFSPHLNVKGLSLKDGHGSFLYKEPRSQT